ncbi:uncharacterized protein Z519_06901 [Cladophialophora bantiana CBS 173.52]|uniref:Uncharacterized protein n=1 Tax=Cladophialophora bantiana (strain ATCC 10958 / CBS 173.52 / CDC B-1940 / NIH 8579) TaxID=1442370 RepID=A0A0D2G314_CLAB1|nr:uncharacterized protein Z519_06901 [Cladophialophora bantiana CBS 173.52]KIW93052.1 hypothetical protein Z519_06901 [Cladophialophora bantiana CBS 173.52]
MAAEVLPDHRALREAFDCEIFSSSGTPLRFGSLFYDCDVYPAEKRVLVVFIRHFFCGNCQEYVRRLSSMESPFHPSQKSLQSSTSIASMTNFSKPASRTLPTVIIIGPGQPTLIASYKSLAQCPFDIYANPSTRLYELLGMHRTLSLGHRAPDYIEQSLFNGALKSAWQIVRRVGNGDAMSGGNWDVNGGEFLFTRSASGTPLMSSKSSSPTRSGSRSSQSREWQVSWCHRMLNSRDHTEIVNLQYHACLPELPSRAHSRATSPTPLKSILINGGRAHSKTPSRSYSTERLGSCPGPDIPKSREEVLSSQRFIGLHSRGHSKSISHHQRRSRSTSVGSQTNSSAKQNHERVWSGISNASASCLELQPTASYHGVASPISGIEEDNLKPRKSFSATVAERVSFGALLGRSRSFSSPPRTGSALSMFEAGEAVYATPSRPISRASTLKSTLKSTATPFSLCTETGSKRKLKDAKLSLSNTASPLSDPSMAKSQPKHMRSRTFSFSRPTLPLRRRAKSQIEIDQDGVMFVDGVEFVNVISFKARIEASSAPDQRRERADSGLGMEVERRNHKGAGGNQIQPEVPENKKYSVLTTLPEIAAMTR